MSKGDCTSLYSVPKLRAMANCCLSTRLLSWLFYPSSPLCLWNYPCDRGSRTGTENASYSCSS